MARAQAPTKSDREGARGEGKWRRVLVRLGRRGRVRGRWFEEGGLGKGEEERGGVFGREGEGRGGRGGGLSKGAREEGLKV